MLFLITIFCFGDGLSGDIVCGGNKFILFDGGWLLLVSMGLVVER
ncbi:hypothetical protein SALWKB29_2037 [Snodgrassella communis]|uniref:Uncharacterized protein n=1 Tax=Snodgrassella communis TaxID=2946699 RepID=A0A836MNA6_9NEIS|nr:hypothetical protein SALWKB29_2037 [Snodgrassella communis]